MPLKVATRALLLLIVSFALIKPAAFSQQRQSAPGVPLINEQTTQGLQRFDQAQTVAGLELPRPAPRGSC